MSEIRSNLGFAGKLAAFALKSPLTPIIALFIVLLGIVAFFATPKEENPQIDVPTASVIVAYPGANAQETQKAIVDPLSRKLNELTGVKHIYGMAQNGVGIVTVQFEVGEKKSESLLKVYDRVMQNLDVLPINARNPIVKPMDIDEVPIYAVAISGKGYSSKDLYNVARSMVDTFASTKNVSVVGIKGGEKRQFNILLNPNRLHEFDLTPAEVLNALAKSSIAYSIGRLDGAKFSVGLALDGFIKSPDDLGQIILKTANHKVVYLSDVAAIQDGINLQDKEYALIGKDGNVSIQATIFASKKRGSNAVDVANALDEKIKEIKAKLPSGIELVVTRNDGLKAKHVVDELAFHLAISIGIIVILLAFMLGLKEALIVSITIPLVFAVTLFVGMLVGQTINRITLFALILSLGLLVDDAIVVIENIHRHFRANPKARILDTVIIATNEVGKPTYIATIAVVCAFLPMIFVSGMMGSYMGPIPLNVPVAMFSSLIIAFAISPWLAVRLLKPHAHSEPLDIRTTKLYTKYNSFVRPMFNDNKKRAKFWLVIFVFLFASLSLPVFLLVQAKMLPGSNVNTFNITIDLPTNSSIKDTAQTSQCVGSMLAKDAYIKDYETFVGVGGIVDFNGLLRGNAIKKGDNIAEIRVNLKDKSERNAQSGDIVSTLRPMIQKCETLQGANIKLVEDPPGPPVLSTLVTEVYGGSANGRRVLAEKIEYIFKQTKNVVDVDILGDKESVKYEIKPNRQKAGEFGISVDQIALALSVGMYGQVASVAQVKNEADPICIFVRYSDKKSPQDALATPIRASDGKLYRVGDVATIETSQNDYAISSKDLKPVELIVGEMNKSGSVYAMFQIRSKIFDLLGYKVESDDTMRMGLVVTDGATGEIYHVKNDGEWTVTFDTFRDLGSAFIIALVLIYFLLVAYYGNFKKPGIIAATIPLTLIGIMFGHYVMNIVTPTYFTATSMIGFIALAGIVVRNAVMLVDFTDELIISGKSIQDAVIEASVIRAKPIFLTALAIALASFVIVLDPVWNGLAVSLIFGVMSATILTLVVTPLMYWGHLIKKGKNI